MRTEELIARLEQDLAPVCRLAPPHLRLARWLALALPVLAAIVLAVGPRPDLGERMADPRFALETAAALATGLVAGWAALASTVPGLGGWRLAAPLAPASLWLAAAGEACWREWRLAGMESLTPVLEVQCIPEIALVSAAPLAALVVLARRGAALRPGLTGMLAALAAAGLASAALNLFHHAEAAVVVLVWHAGAVLLASAAFGLVGQRLFRLGGGG